MDVLKHVHAAAQREPTLAEMTARRMLGQDNIADAVITEITHEPWKPEYPRREKPDGEG